MDSAYVKLKMIDTTSNNSRDVIGNSKGYVYPSLLDNIGLYMGSKIANV